MSLFDCILCYFGIMVLLVFSAIVSELLTDYYS